MEPKILNFVDAMRLGKLLKAHNINSVDFSTQGILDMLSLLSPVAYLEIVLLLSGISKDKISSTPGADIVNLLTSGLMTNKVNSLLLWMGEG